MSLLPVVLLTHNDLDGISVQLVLEAKFGKNNIQTFPLSYEQIDNWVINTDLSNVKYLFIGDVFVRSEEGVMALNYWADHGVSIYIFDHHASSDELQAKTKAKYADFGEGDGNSCSGMKAYKWAFGDSGKGPKKIIEQINHYDTTGDINSPGGYVNTLITINNREWVLDFLRDKDKIHFDDDVLRQLVKYKKQASTEIFTVKNKAKQYELDGYSIVIVRTKYFFDDIIDYFRKYFDVVIAIRSEVKLSLRAGDTKRVRVDKIAELFDGGGGHPHAAGAKLPKALSNAEDFIFKRMKDNKDLLKGLTSEA